MSTKDKYLYMRPKTILSNNTLECVRQLSETNIKISDISKKTGLSIAILNRVIKENNFRYLNPWRKWTIEDINWLVENFHKTSTKDCSKFLNKPVTQITKKGRDLKLERKRYMFEIYNQNPLDYFNITKFEIAYFLGLLWGDGSIRCGPRKIRIMMNKADFDSLDLQSKIGKMTYQIIDTRKNPTWKDTISASFKNKYIYDFLNAHDYYEKSTKSPCKILEKIPLELQMYFFRGWVDADGNFVKNKRVFSMAAAFEQDWTSMIKLAKKLNIKYNINKNYNPKGRGSVFRLNANSTEIFGNYIYGNSSNLNVGLLRKYQIFQSYRNIKSRLSSRIQLD